MSKLVEAKLNKKLIKRLSKRITTDYYKRVLLIKHAKISRNKNKTNLNTNQKQALPKVFTLAEKTLVQHFLEHLVGVDETSCKSMASHHEFPTHARI